MEVSGQNIITSFHTEEKFPKAFAAALLLFAFSSHTSRQVFTLPFFFPFQAAETKITRLPRIDGTA